MQLNSYLKPSYDTMVNKTKISFHYLLQDILTSTRLNEIVMIGVVIFVLIVSVFYLYFKVNSFYEDTDTVLDIIIEFDNEETKNIVSYWETV